jgi:hypothetical protein
MALDGVYGGEKSFPGQGIFGASKTLSSKVCRPEWIVRAAAAGYRFGVAVEDVAPPSGSANAMSSAG